MREVSRTDGPEIDLVRQYLDEIGSFTLLTANEEVALAKRIEAGVYAAALLSGTATTTHRPEMRRRDLALVAEDGRRAKEHMIRANLRLVVSVARRHNRHRLPMLDAIQEGNLGLIRARTHVVEEAAMFATDTPVIDLFRVDDTCDRCGAQAKVLVLLNSGGELVFCGHHARRHRAALEPIAFIVEHSSPVH